MRLVRLRQGGIAASRHVQEPFPDTLVRHDTAGGGIGPAALDRGPQCLALSGIVLFRRGREGAG
jgi:hypothetical protein